MRVPNPDDDVCRKTRQAKEKKKVKWELVREPTRLKSIGIC